MRTSTHSHAMQMTDFTVRKLRTSGLYQMTDFTNKADFHLRQPHALLLFTQFQPFVSVEKEWVTSTIVLNLIKQNKTVPDVKRGGLPND